MRSREPMKLLHLVLAACVVLAASCIENPQAHPPAARYKAPRAKDARKGRTAVTVPGLPSSGTHGSPSQLSGPPPPPGFPNASTTGVPAGTTLQRAGPQIVTENGVVLDSLDIEGGVIVKASNVVIRRCRITDPNDQVVKMSETVQNLRIEDSELDGLGTALVGIGGGGSFAAERVNLHGSVDGVRAASGMVLLDSYIHDLVRAADKHNDGAQASGPAKNIVIRHNSILNPNHENSGIYLSSHYGPIDGVTIDNNFLDGGGRTVYVLDKGSGFGTPTNVSVMNNRFGRDFNRALGYGKFFQSGNAWADNGSPIADITTVQRDPGRQGNQSSSGN